MPPFFPQVNKKNDIIFQILVLERYKGISQNKYGFQTISPFGMAKLFPIVNIKKFYSLSTQKRRFDQIFHIQLILRISLFMIKLVWEHYDGKTYRQECAEILADSYMFNNPFVKPLKLKKEDMIDEFLGQLDRRTFRWIFIYFDADLYQQGIKEIVGVCSTGDIFDFKNPDKQLDFNKVPTTSLVRTYMRYKTLEPFWNKVKTVKQYEYLYGGSTAVKPKYMGTGIISYYMIQEITTHLVKEYGFKSGLANAINTIAKKYLARLYNQTTDVIQLEEMYVVDGDYYPFKGTGLTQDLFVADLDVVLQKCKSILASRQPKL
ncbi:hypothetical protein pb186bvf_010543 [Paramecium bursaria]